MRFVECGPSIPDELLRARDEGQVVFFCGAGVSRARARLPDFFGLANSVLSKLGAIEDSEASKLLQYAQKVSTEISVSGLISADRVFSLLEREFTTADIQTAVAQCLSTANDVDQSAHTLLVRLARTPEQKVQLVTTNFESLR